MAQNWFLGQKWQNFPVNSLMLYAKDRRNILLRQEIKILNRPIWAVLILTRRVEGIRQSVAHGEYDDT